MTTYVKQSNARSVSAHESEIQNGHWAIQLL